MSQIVVPPAEKEEKETSAVPAELSKDVEAFAPGWAIYSCADEMDPGLHEELAGKKNVLVTHPISEDAPCMLFQEVDIPEGKTTLHLVVGHHEEGDWNLAVADKGLKFFETVVGSENSEDGWMEVSVDLSEFAGSTLPLVLMNEANGWQYEAAYWAKIEIVTE
jgi:hypothetical protein